MGHKECTAGGKEWCEEGGWNGGMVGDCWGFGTWGVIHMAEDSEETPWSSVTHAATVPPQSTLGPQLGKSQRECEFLRKLSGMVGSIKLKKKKYCGSMETMEGLQLERQYSVKASWPRMYFPEGKIGNVQYSILATSIPSASQIQARPHHMVFGNYTGRIQRSWNRVTFPQSLGMGCALPIPN